MVTVASYNCQQSQDRALFFLTNTAAGADAMCTQESGTRLALNSYSANTPNMAVADGFINDGCMVVTSTKDRVQASESLPIRAGKNQNRSALLVKLRGCGLIVVNVHLTSGNESRSKPELTDIYNHVIQKYPKKAPWLIIGDFNHDPRDFSDAMGVQFACGPEHSGGNYLDWAISNANIEPGSYPRYFGSDHGPWYVEVNI